MISLDIFIFLSFSSVASLFPQSVISHNPVCHIFKIIFWFLCSYEKQKTSNYSACSNRNTKRYECGSIVFSGFLPSKWIWVLKRVESVRCVVWNRSENSCSQRSQQSLNCKQEWCASRKLDSTLTFSNLFLNNVEKWLQQTSNHSQHNSTSRAENMWSTCSNNCSTCKSTVHQILDPDSSMNNTGHGKRCNDWRADCKVSTYHTILVQEWSKIGRHFCFWIYIRNVIENCWIKYPEECWTQHCNCAVESWWSVVGSLYQLCLLLWDCENHWCDWSQDSSEHKDCDGTSDVVVDLDDHLTVKLVKESSYQDQGENLEWAGSADKGGEGNGQAESHLEGASGSASKSPVDSAVSLWDPDEEGSAKYLFALVFDVVNISKSSLDIDFGPEGIN